MGLFNVIIESNTNSFQTKPIEIQDAERLARVVLTILVNHLESNQRWVIYYRKGSVTIQNHDIKGHVIKAFVDYGNLLARKCGISLHDNPIAVGIELTEMTAFTRESIRNELGRRFTHYLDPRIAGNEKWCLLPQKPHKYDVLFLEQGPCEGEYEEKDLEDLVLSIKESIEKHYEEDVIWASQGVLC